MLHSSVVLKPAQYWCLWKGGLTGCGLHGHSLVSVLLVNPIKVFVCKENIGAHDSSVSFMSASMFLDIVVEQWRTILGVS